MPDEEPSAEEQTTILNRAKSIATKKSVAVGALSGGVSFATLTICYQVFVTAANHRTDMATHWQEIKDRQAETKQLAADLSALREVVAINSAVKEKLESFIRQQSDRDKAQWEVIAKKRDKQ